MYAGERVADVNAAGASTQVVHSAQQTHLGQVLGATCHREAGIISELANLQAELAS